MLWFVAPSATFNLAVAPVGPSSPSGGPGYQRKRKTTRPRPADHYLLPSTVIRAQMILRASARIELRPRVSIAVPMRCNASPSLTYQASTACRIQYHLTALSRIDLTTASPMRIAMVLDAQPSLHDGGEPDLILSLLAARLITPEEAAVLIG